MDDGDNPKKTQKNLLTSKMQKKKRKEDIASNVNRSKNMIRNATPAWVPVIAL